MGDEAPLRALSPIEEPLDEPEPVRLPPLPVLLEPPVLPELPDMLEPMPEEPLPAEPAVEPLLEPIPALLPALEPEPLLMPEELVEPVDPELPMELEAGDAAEEVEPGGVVPDGSEPGVDEAFDDGFMGEVDMEVS